MPASAIAGVLVLGPMVLGMLAWWAVEWLFGHPVANGVMKAAVVIVVCVVVVLLHEWAFDAGLLVIDHNMTNITSVEACT